MVTSLLTLVPATGTDPRAEIASARLARDKMQLLLSALRTQRDDARAAFLRTLATDLAALKDTPTKGFTDAEFGKYTAWNAASKELDGRIGAFESVAPLLDDYVHALAEKHYAEFIALLTEERAALELQLEKEDNDKATVEARIEAVEAELAEWSTGNGAAKRSGSTAGAKSAAKRSKTARATAKASARKK